MPKTQAKQYQGLRDTLQTRYNEKELSLLDEAWEFAKLAHGTHLRKNGELYISHPLETARHLSSWKLDISTIIAGLLHDSTEDGGAQLSDISEIFGQDIASLVERVTKISELRLRGSGKDVFVESLRKMILVMARDLRVVFIKLADRLHNMETLSALPIEKQKKIARETLEVFAPIAERMGMGSVKSKLEDLSFSYLYSEDYSALLKNSTPYYKSAASHIRQIKGVIDRELKKNGIKGEVKGRQKHYYSLWKKLSRPEIDGDFDKIHDIVALRIIVEKPHECYVTLGVVHGLFKPVPYIGLSDFIAQPKPNGYQSIHTKVFGPSGRIVEVQIRTHEMHEQAEHGAAAHWAYSDLKNKGVSGDSLEEGKIAVPSSKLNWVKELVAWQKQLGDSEEFVRAVKFDGLQHRNFVFSPQGDVYDLPKGATPIDFAYAVHTKLALYITGAKVNGKIVTLDYKLNSGDVVEILKGKNARVPSQHWLSFVVTTKAHRSIVKARSSQ